MNTTDIKNKVLEGCKLAMQKLIEKKRLDDSYLVVSDGGRAVKVKAKDIKL
jgi:hypothetical protein